jgi:magnesium chelatase subunit H
MICNGEDSLSPAAGLQAFGNVVRRMLEAQGRGMWNASQETLDQLRTILNDIEDELEGVK